MTNSTSWAVESPSKTYICHVDYELGGVTNLVVIPIDVIRTDGVERKQFPILSQNLRRKAITEYLTERGPGKKVAFQLEAHKNDTSRPDDDVNLEPTNYLTFFESDPDCLKKLKNGSTADTPLSETMGITKTANGTATPSHVLCSLNFDQMKTLPDQDTEVVEYWKKINLLLLSRAKTTVPGMGLKPDVSSTRTGSLLQEANSKKTGKVAQHTRMADAKITLRGDSNINLLFRTVLKLDPSHHKLRVETDLVAGVKGDTVVSDLAQNLFGRFISDPTNHQYLRQLRTALIGLNVVRTYAPSQKFRLATGATTSGRSFIEGNVAITPPRKTQEHTPLSTLSDTQQNAKASTAKPKLGNTSQHFAQKFPDSIIVDLKPAGDVPRFWKNEAKEIKSPNLPFANIGKDAWVPLELLRTVRDSSALQMITLVGDMTALLQERRLHYHPDANKGDPSKFADALIQALRKSHPGFQAMLPKAQGVFATFDPTPKDSAPDQRDRAIPSGAGIKCGVVCIHPRGLQSPNFEQFAMSIPELLRDHGKLNEKQKIFNVNTAFDPPVLVIPDTNSLLFSPESNPDVKPFYESGLDTIFAIIDDRGRNRQDVCYIRAELQKFGNKKIGAIVQCMTRKELETRADKHKGLLAHVLIGTLQRVNIMHGNLNFAIQLLLPISKRKLLVVGAHISHPGSGSAISCPSVATLVSSVDDALVHYPGSARLQPTLGSSAWRKKQEPSKLKYQMNSKIDDIENMMVERVKAWVAKQGTAQPPHVVFYRHSNREFDQKLIKDEMAAIRRACAQFDWSEGEATLGYILVNKNAHLASPYHGAQGTEFTTNAASSFKISVEGKKEAGYKYDYFHFAIANQYDMLSSVQRRVRYPAGEDVKNDEQMTEMMNGYLLGYGTVEASTIPEPVRRNPWMKELDDKVFYL